MTKTAEQFDAEADAILAEIETGFGIFFDKMMARCTAFANELDASDISLTFKQAIGRKLLTGVDKALEAVQEKQS